MARVLLQTSVTYLLTFQTPELPEDGSFRRLRVELQGGPRGARVVHRTGYFVPRPFSELTAEERRQESAELLLSGQEVQELGADAFAGALRVDPATGLARVPAVVEIGRDVLGAEPPDAPLAFEIRAYAFDSEGEVAGSLAQVLAIERAKLAAAPSGLKFFGELELPAGSYDVRVLVRSLATGRVTLARSAVDVPAAGEGSALLEPLFIQAADEHWLLVRQARVAEPAGGEGAARAYPFVLAGESYLPAVHGEVAAGEQARLVLMGYRLPEGELRIESRVESLAGEVLQAGKLDFLGRDQGGEGRPDQVVLGFAPQGLVPGDYRLELSLQGSNGVAIGQLTVPVRVVRR